MQSTGSLSPSPVLSTCTRNESIDSHKQLDAPGHVIGTRSLSQQEQELSITKIMNCVGSLMAPRWPLIAVSLLDDSDKLAEILRSNGTEPMPAVRHILERWKETTPKTERTISRLIQQLTNPNNFYAEIIHVLLQALEAGQDFLDHEYDQVWAEARPLPPLQQLNNMLPPAESKAEAIGYQLLAYSDVRELVIQHRGCETLLTGVIDKWQEAYPQRANLDNLVNALRSQEVRLNSVADELDLTYPKTTQNHGDAQESKNQSGLEARLMSARVEVEFWRAQAQVSAVNKQRQEQQIRQQAVRLRELESQNQWLQEENTQLGRDADCYLKLYYSKDEKQLLSDLEAFKKESNQKNVDLEQRLLEQEALLIQEREKYRQLEQKHQMLKRAREEQAAEEKKRCDDPGLLGTDGNPKDADFTDKERVKIKDAKLSRKRYQLLATLSLPANAIMAEKLGLGSDVLARIRLENGGVVDTEQEGMRLFCEWAKKFSGSCTWFDYAQAVHDACLDEHKTHDKARETYIEVLRTAALAAVA